MEKHSNFIKTIMEEDLKNKKHDTIITRFPPEPNGFLHIGHARAIIINFELAKNFGGYTNLRFDDTNPEKEEEKYVHSIIEDVKWLGYEPKAILYASDYFNEMYQRALLLIKKGLAYVDDQSAEEISKTRGTLNTPGLNSPYRNRTVDENLNLFIKMKEGHFQEGEKVLRAKIDMANPNINLRDPVIYRISYEAHHRTKNDWVIYPMYDYAHPLEDAIEGITHSLCSLEFENHRPIYDWFVKETEMEKIPRQIEFGRLNIENTVMSKRYLKVLVDNKIVTGWDDPRLPTLSGLRNRGYTKEAIKEFILATGLSKTNASVSMAMLESFIRDDLQNKTSKMMAVLDPLKVTITNYPDNKIEEIIVPLDQNNPSLGEKTVYFSKHLYIEKDDFILEKPNKKWKRLAKDIEVRLFNAYFIKCHDVIYNDKGEIIELLVTYDEETKSGSGFNKRKPNGTIHFVSAAKALPATFNLLEPIIFDGEEPLLDRINKNSWQTKQGYVEKAMENKDEAVQFIRNGYFIRDQKEKEKLAYHRIVELKSSFK
ncbi:MAG: glutamine--tRNA ligase/YqeY domain fusion protein [Acholeplasmatales bacterium]|jgi:glutaminyl-tRNA synthetase|nr:glutamine--tRNA ligase/YqeY domain fusion protein [Acholeplasmataceae bacterium]MDY0115419.1 glutamine--tRNA ligase/YqeY domain fusion protein [Acholeplasmatales bacterium]MCK9234575.1 glutamine--tRNA ligase/YqeY domain fusion protein [Acholeplasmataceae bacterium]MCK9289098.1 glutamine--tRNA ligase/YqeY domain fusion protein [Acholeplasmataceae bacterium]MCK9427399.1 glutamine--tRNA ligase/YqeY domain fusion protein [Acholeplasmataceae bacterium]